MRLETSQANRLDWLDYQRRCGASSYFGSMWHNEIADTSTYVVSVNHVLPEPLDVNALRSGLLVLAQSFRDLCIFDRERSEPKVFPLCNEPDDIQQLAERGFYFQNSQLVCEFLEQHRFLIKVLFEVRDKFDAYFGVDSESCLEVFTDPEDDGDSKLFALILTALPSQEASARLDRLDQEWWLEQPYEVRRAMNIDIDYLDGSV